MLSSQPLIDHPFNKSHFAKEAELRPESEIFEHLREVCLSPGYAHAIALYWMRANMLRSAGGVLTAGGLGDAANGLTRREIDILVGLAVQGNLDLVLPRPSVIRKYMRETDALMEELQTVIANSLGRFLAASGTDFGEALREPIIYGPESAYEFQYLNMAVDRYSSDNKWLTRNLGFTIEDAVAVVKAVVAVRAHAIEAATRGMRTISASRRNLLGAFVVGVDQVAAQCNLAEQIVCAVLEAFAMTGGNSGFATASDFNAAAATPLIRTGNSGYLLFQTYSLAEAIYTTPSFWMSEDMHYRTFHSHHRGRFTESFCKKRLSTVFGRDRVFSNLRILAGNRVLGEVDVLVVFGDRAVIVQAKSKRLTIDSRKGDLQRAKDDFAKAVQHAYNQGYSCAEHLLNPACSFELEDGRPLALGSEFKEMYIVCAVSDSYPALTFQASHFLQYERTERIQPPLVADVFLIDVVSEMLATPLQFLSYLNRRVNYHEQIMTPDELAVLALHLRANLWIGDGTDLLAILDKGTFDLDVAMMVRRAGMRGKATPDGVLARLKDTVVGRVLTQIERDPQPASLELGLMLLRLNEALVQKIDSAIEGWSKQSGGRQTHGLSVSMQRADTGLTIQANQLPPSRAEILLRNTCLVRKYESQVTKWFGMVLDVRNLASLRHAVVISYEWEPDEELAKAANRFPGKATKAR